MTISSRIFSLMQEKNISQSELSKRTGISTRTISDWKRKQTNPSADKILPLCEVLGVSPMHLLGGEETSYAPADSGQESDLLREEIRNLNLRLEEAKASNMAKETFLSNMSHDIRTPMNAIVGMTALAKKHIDEKARVADALEKIETASGHLLNLINEVLDMSRIDSGRMQLADERFSLSDLLHDVMTIVQPQIDQKGHSFHLETGEIPCEYFRGDALRLRQIYVNIINNAVKYTPDGGRIEVSVQEEKKEDLCHLFFRCTDNGIGMSEEFLQRIFEPFERAGSSTVTKIEGTGLGMSIVRKIVEAMNGTVSVKSSPGAGTSVSINIPLHFMEESVQPAAAALKDKRLLIIESDEDMAQVLDGYLKEFQIPHTIVPSASAAVSALTDAEFRQTPYHAVVIGRKQENSGSIYDIAAYLNKSRPQLCIILVSDQNWSEIQYQATRAGIRYFIPVPVFRKSLIGGLNAALSEGESGSSSFAAPDLTGKRILLVEDNLINQEIAKEILSLTKAEIQTAENGQIALSMFESSPEGYYSLILMDVQMPVMNGYEAVRRIRALSRADAGTVPVYAMTANTFAEDIAKSREAGMNGHLAKPVDINALMQMLRQVL